SSGGHHGRPEPGYDPDDVIDQVAGNTQAVEGRGKMAGGPVEVGIGDAQAAVCRGKVRPAVALGTAQRLAEDRDEVGTVPRADAAGKDPAEPRTGEQPPVEALDGGGNAPPAADRMVNVDRRRIGRSGGIGASRHGRSPWSGIYRDDARGTAVRA